MAATLANLSLAGDPTPSQILAIFDIIDLVERAHDPRHIADRQRAIAAYVALDSADDRPEQIRKLVAAFRTHLVGRGQPPGVHSEDFLKVLAKTYSVGELQEYVSPAEVIRLLDLGKNGDPKWIREKALTALAIIQPPTHAARLDLISQLISLRLPDPIPRQNEHLLSEASKSLDQTRVSLLLEKERTAVLDRGVKPINLFDIKDLIAPILRPILFRGRMPYFGEMAELETSIELAGSARIQDHEFNMQLVRLAKMEDSTSPKRDFAGLRGRALEALSRISPTDETVLRAIHEIEKRTEYFQVPGGAKLVSVYSILGRSAPGSPLALSYLVDELCSNHTSAVSFALRELMDLYRSHPDIFTESQQARIKKSLERAWVHELAGRKLYGYESLMRDVGGLKNLAEVSVPEIDFDVGDPKALRDLLSQGVDRRVAISLLDRLAVGPNSESNCKKHRSFQAPLLAALDYFFKTENWQLGLDPILVRNILTVANRTRIRNAHTLGLATWVVTQYPELPGDYDSIAVDWEGFDRHLMAAIQSASDQAHQHLLPSFPIRLMKGLSACVGRITGLW